MGLRESISDIAEKLHQLQYGSFNIQDAGMTLDIKWGLWECIQNRECRQSGIIPTFPIWAHTTINASHPDKPITTAHFHFIEDPQHGIKLDSMEIRYREFDEGSFRLSLNKKITTLDDIPSRHAIDGIVTNELERQQHEYAIKKNVVPTKANKPRL